jgi:hypothetical protein
LHRNPSSIRPHDTSAARDGKGKQDQNANRHNPKHEAAPMYVGLLLGAQLGLGRAFRGALSSTERDEDAADDRGPAAGDGASPR